MKKKLAFAFLILCSTLRFPTLTLASTGTPKPELLVTGEFGITEHQAMCFISLYSDGELRFGYGNDCRMEAQVNDPDCLSSRLSGTELNLVRISLQTIHSQVLTLADPAQTVQYLDGYDFHLGANPELRPFASNDYPYTADDQLVGAVGSSERRTAKSLRNILFKHLRPILKKFHKNY